MSLRKVSLPVQAILVGAVALSGVQLSAGEPPAPPKGGEAKTAPKDGEAKKPKDIEEVIEGIPKAPLEENVILQSGNIKIPVAIVDRVEAAYVASEKKRQPKFVMTPEMKTYLRKRFAFRFLANALVEKYVADNKLETPKEQFETQFAKFKDAKKTEGGSYEQWLADNGLSDDEFRKFWGANYAIEQNMAKEVKEEEVNKAFEQYAESIPLRRAAHILFMYKGSERAPATIGKTKEEAKAAAEDMIKKLKAGDDFGKLAAGNSDCPSKAQGGDLNFFPRKGAMAEQFADATYKLAKTGDYTEAPVETPFGFHVIKLTEMRKSEEMKEQMKQHLVSEKFGKQMQQLIEDAAVGAKFNEKML
jgi:peptidyl-prolyl cis-trans isomerase C